MTDREFADSIYANNLSSDDFAEIITKRCSDVARREMQAFLESLLNPEQFGWAVTEEVRNEARKLLGIAKVEEEATRR